ncbi:MFS transporter [Amycolatopsis taiwanensis]|uniref:MFS transporter n=1 Tax=Amycolatopsis taiwanensis TaxID=342230 RepID=UPI0004B8CE1F|nr:MFS transporter [Amycolatopsis taiwanensis]
MIVTQTSAPVRAWLGAGAALAAVGWGANQFAPLIVLYSTQLGLSPAALDAMFGLYAVGLVPALLAGGRLSDRIGRRRVVLPALLASLVATCLLMAGGRHPELLFTGRFLAGVASGLAFGTGAAWLKELSAESGDASAGPRRSTIAMTTGFAGGPLVAGLCAQWLPSPTVTAYVGHLVVLTTATAAVWRTPDPARTSAKPVAAAPGARGLRRHFLLVVLPFAPWVFGTAAIGLAYLPALVVDRVGGQALMFSAFVTGVPAIAGIAAQPLARAFLRRPRGVRLLPASMALVLLGIGCAAWAAHARSPLMVVLASLVLGVAYGVTQFAGLAEVQHIADPRSLGTATATYQVVSYLGFALPFLLALAENHLHRSPSSLLLAMLGLAAVATAWLAAVTALQRRQAR